MDQLSHSVDVRGVPVLGSEQSFTLVALLDNCPLALPLKKVVDCVLLFLLRKVSHVVWQGKLLLCW